MSNWTFSELDKYDNQVCKIAEEMGLDWFPIVYEVCDYYEMIGNMAYHGLPAHYRHWSYGKSFERTHQLYRGGMEGLPYELIINANPSIAYLMKENPMYLQILIMAHCVGHSDFFKNNINFSHTRPGSVIARNRSAKKRVQEYIEDPSIGVERVEEILDSAHAIQYQTERYGRKRVSHTEKREEYIRKIKDSEDQKWAEFVLDQIPLESDFDILGFIQEHGRHLDEWEKDLINIVRAESMYFMPQIRTKILNEGHACFWHYKILNALDLPQEYHIPFMKSHNQVVRPHLGKINPYDVGFYLFKRIEEEYGLDECFFVREVHHDESALREFIDQKACQDLGLFSYSLKPNRNGSTHTIDDVSDDIGWEGVKEAFLEQTGVNGIPRVCVDSIDRAGTLVLRHEHDGRDLELGYAEAVVKHVSTLWEGAVKLLTILEGDEIDL